MGKTVLKLRYLLPAVMLVLAGLMTLHSCTKRGINGDLDGMWQIMEIEHSDPQTGEISVTCPEARYISFQLHVCQLGTANGSCRELSARLTYTDDHIDLDFVAMTPEWEGRLDEWGISSTQVSFDILVLDKSTLVMRDGDVTLTCRKF